MVDANDSKSFGEIHASSTLALGTKQLTIAPCSRWHGAFSFVGRRIDAAGFRSEKRAQTHFWAGFPILSALRRGRWRPSSSSSNFLAAAFGHSPKMALINTFTPSMDCSRIFTEVPPCIIDNSIVELPFLLSPTLLKRYQASASFREFNQSMVKLGEGKSR